MVGKAADECAVGKKTFTRHTTKGPQKNLRGAVGIMVRPGDETVRVHVHLKQCFIALRSPTHTQQFCFCCVYARFDILFSKARESRALSECLSVCVCARLRGGFHRTRQRPAESTDEECDSV